MSGTLLREDLELLFVLVLVVVLVLVAGRCGEIPPYREGGVGGAGGSGASRQTNLAFYTNQWSFTL
jgi:hypothetical protein